MCSSEASSGMEKDMNLFKDTGQLDLQFHVQSLQLLFFGFKRMLMSSVKRCKTIPTVDTRFLHFQFLLEMWFLVFSLFFQDSRLVQTAIVTSIGSDGSSAGHGQCDTASYASGTTCCCWLMG